jgi:hypothetical protein
VYDSALAGNSSDAQLWGWAQALAGQLQRIEHPANDGCMSRSSASGSIDNSPDGFFLH